jgi:hypothetical protein
MNDPIGELVGIEFAGLRDFDDLKHDEIGRGIVDRVVQPQLLARLPEAARIASIIEGSTMCFANGIPGLRGSMH